VNQNNYQAPQQQYQAPQQQYQAPPRQYMMPMEDISPMTVGRWIITFIVLAIPLINIIMIFVWGFGSGNVSRKNYCRAILILALIMIAVYIVLFLVIGIPIINELKNFTGFTF
jgi:hypothetical protein